MSMLTPPGMGGKYRIKGARYPRMRRRRNHRRIVLVSVAAVAALGLVGWGTFQLIDIFSGGGTASASGASGKNAADCGAKEKSKQAEKTGEAGPGKAGQKLPKPDSITVNVLNATTHSGLAKDTADELKKRGFKIGEVGNAPKKLDKKVKSAGVLMTAPGAETSANLKVLGTQFEGVDTRYDDRKGEDVDFVIGDDFKKLEAEKAAEKALTALNKPKPAPSASRC